MKTIKTLLEATDDNDNLEMFMQHANNLGLAVEKDAIFDDAHAFAMRNTDEFDIVFYYDADWPKSVSINYQLGEGKEGNLKVPFDRFMSFDAEELKDLHTTVQEKANEYAQAVQTVKKMPAEIKKIITGMVK